VILLLGGFAALSFASTGKPSARPGKSQKGKPCKKPKGRQGHCSKKPPKNGPGKGKGKKPSKPSQPGSSPSQPGTPQPIPAQPSPGSEAPPAPTPPPDTTIDSGPSEGATLFEGSASFAFSSPGGGAASFECSLDSAAFSGCQSPVQYSGLSSGSHSFKVRALGATSNPDPTPATRSFKVDLTRADTTITAQPPQTVAPNVSQALRFESDDPGATFECKFGAVAFTPCASPWSIPVGGPGNYSGEVRAIGSNGQADPSPASFAFRAAEPEQRCGTLTHDETWSTETLSGVVLTCSVSIPDGIKLEIERGVFVKSAGGAIEVDGGALEANGTAAEPVVFTSLADDSVGGDTGGSSTEKPYANVVLGAVGTVALDHAKLREADEWPLRAQGGCGGNCLENDPNNSLTVTNSELEGPLLTGWVDLSGFATTGATANRFTGPASRRAIVFEQGAFRAQTLTLTPALNATAWGGSVETPGQLNVYDDAKLRLEPGTFMKVPVNVDHGALEANGTAAEPVVFTSLADDSVGGDTGGDGSLTTPKEGEGAGISVVGFGSKSPALNLGYVVVRYATVGLSVHDEAQVAVRGIFEHNKRAISACNWEAGCSVDAGYVYWGSSEGPFPSGHPALACGAVTTDPYLTSQGGSTADSGIFGVENCDGSATPDDQLAQASSNFDTAIAKEQIDCGNGFQDACQAIETAQACLGAAHDLAVQNFPVPVDAKSTATAAGHEFVSQGSAYLRSSSSQIVSDIGHVTGFAGKLLGVASTIIGLAQAFNQCAP
jgi:hypothetical protein